jgi:hypothetical protein
MSNNFEFVPDILAVRVKKGGFLGMFKKTKTIYIKVPAQVTTADIELLSNFFDIVAFERALQFIEHFKADSPTGQQFYANIPTEVLAAQFKPYSLENFLNPVLQNKFNSLSAAVNNTNSTNKNVSEIITTGMAVLDVVNKTHDLLKKVFGSSKKTEIVSSNTNLGFDAYSRKTVIMSFVGVEVSKMAAFKEYLLRILKLTDTQKYALSGFFEFSADNQIHDIDSIYKDQRGTYKAFHVVYALNRELQVFNIFVLDTSTDFKIADDLYIMRTSKSKWGGIMQSEKISFKKVPHTLTQTEAEQLEQFIQISAYGKFKAYLDAVAGKIF